MQKWDAAERRMDSAMDEGSQDGTTRFAAMKRQEEPSGSQQPQTRDIKPPPQATTWVRSLTQDGDVEENPGPPTRAETSRWYAGPATYADICRRPAHAPSKELQRVTSKVSSSTTSGTKDPWKSCKPGRPSRHGKRPITDNQRSPGVDFDQRTCGDREQAQQASPTRPLWKKRTPIATEHLQSRYSSRYPAFTPVSNATPSSIRGS